MRDTDRSAAGIHWKSFRKLLLLQQTASLPSARSLDFKTAPI
jgi:hypothetical protein